MLMSSHADDIIPPVLIVTINGTYHTDDYTDITSACADEFHLVLRERANDMLQYLHDRGYCDDTDVYMATADTVGYISGHYVS